MRTAWLRVDRLLGEHGFEEDDAQSRNLLARHIEGMRLEAEGDVPALKRGWRHGAEDFVQYLTQKLGRLGSAGERACERTETDEQLALRIMREDLARYQLEEAALAGLPKADERKLSIARKLRQHTPMTRRWIATRLQIGSASYLSALLASASDESML